MADELTQPPILKPCPFCGAGAEKSSPNWAGDFYVYCPNYDCNVAPETGYSDAEEAIRVWNTRANPTPDTSLAARLKTLEKQAEPASSYQPEAPVVLLSVVRLALAQSEISVMGAEAVRPAADRGHSGNAVGGGVSAPATQQPVEITGVDDKALLQAIMDSYGEGRFKYDDAAVAEFKRHARAWGLAWK